MTNKTRNSNIAVTRPNWSTPVGVEYAYRTSIFTARDGTEQREAMRQNPRVALKFTTSLTRPRIQRHMQDLNSDQGARFAVRAEWAWATLTAEHTSGGTDLVVDSVPHWAVSGQKVIVETTDREDLLFIGSVDEDTLTITLDDNTSQTYPVGTKVYLAYWTRAQENVQFNALTSRVWQGNMRYEVDPTDGKNSYYHYPTFLKNFRDILFTEPNWRSAPRIDFIQERDVFDPGMGKIEVTAPQTNDIVQLQYTYTGMNLIDSETIISFFKAHKGRRDPFWMPIWFDPIEPSETDFGDDTQFQIDGQEFRESYAGNPLFNTMIKVRPNCDYEYNKIASIGGTANSEITFKRAWDSPVEAGDRIYWLCLVRFDTDTLDVRWLSPTNAEVTVTIKVLPEQTVEWRFGQSGVIPAYSADPWPYASQAVDLNDDNFLEPQIWGGIELNTGATRVQVLVDLLGNDPSPLPHIRGNFSLEAIENGDLFVWLSCSGYYQAGNPLAGSTRQFVQRISQYREVPDNYVSWTTGLPISASGNSFVGVAGPDVALTLGPTLIHPECRFLGFQFSVAWTVTSSWTKFEQLWGVSRAQHFTVRGTDYC